MARHFQVVRQDPEALTRQVWDFSFPEQLHPHEAVLRLRMWQAQERLSRRHGWVKQGEGYRSRTHNGIHFAGEKLPAAQVPFPEDVRQEAMDFVVSRIVLLGPVDPDAER